LEGDYTPFITVKEMVKNVCLVFLSITSNFFPSRLMTGIVEALLQFQQLH